METRSLTYNVEHDVVFVCSGNPDAPIVLACEHASKFIPEKFDNLGLDLVARDSHVAWDPGAKALTILISDAFQAPAVLGNVSRLVYDCNRPPSARDAVPEKSEIFPIPGNKQLAKPEFEARVEAYYRPFEQALTSTLSRHDIKPILVTIHSFTPTYHGEQRDVEIGILHDEDTSVADAMLHIAPQLTDLVVKRNAPYGPEDGVTHTLRHHGLANGLPNVMIEVRNDLLQTAEQCEQISKVLIAMLNEAVSLSGQSGLQKMGVV
jgi:predicted N-formylglutamate amidohydrolase